MRAGQPDEAPDPRHDPVRVVAAAAGRQPAAAGVTVRDRVDQPGRLAHRGRGHAQVRERIPGVRVGAVLRHDEVRPERGGQLGEQRRTAASQAPSPGLRLERHVDRRPGRRSPPPARPTPPVPGNRYRPVSWNDSVSTPGSAAVDRLDAVAVVDVEVDVQDAQPVAPRPGDRERRVVVDAEPRRPVGHRVVEPAARVEGVLDVAAQDRLDRPERAAGDRRRRPRASRRTADRRRPRRCRPPAARTDRARTA